MRRTESIKKKHIGYISPKIPRVEFPPYEGESYESLVPDTLDLAERASFAIHALTSLTDPDADYEVYFPVDIVRNPPVMWHDWIGAAIQPKFLETLPLLRTITGNNLNLDIDKRWAEVVLHMQSEDGLLYMPVVGRPWARYDFSPGFGHFPNFKGYGNFTVGDTGADQFASIVTNGIFAGVMAVYYLQSKNELWKDRIRLLVDRLAQLMVYKDDYCYFPILTANPGAKVSPEDEILDPFCLQEAGGSLAGWIIHGLCQAYLAAGYEPALTLAGKLAVYLMDYSGCYDKKANFTGMAHPHHHIKPMIGLLEYALITKNQKMIQFARKAYEYAKTVGSPTVGFFPYIAGWSDTRYDYATIQRYFKAPTEGCTVADIIALAIKLSQAGVSDYWDDVDRYVRNQFAEIQILKSDWINRMIESLSTVPVDESNFETADRVAERNVGAFIDSTANDIHLVGPGFGIMHCCTCNGSRTIYYIWENILNFEDGTLRVNLLLNRASPWADVDSYIPYEGQVDIKVKKTVNLSVRIPEWANPEETVCGVNEQDRELEWKGRYAQVGKVKKGDVTTLSFPIAERTVKETICGVDYTLIIKGNTVVFIDPPGKNCPFYQRARYRENKVRWVKRERFVSSRPLHWR